MLIRPITRKFSEQVYARELKTKITQYSNDLLKHKLYTSIENIDDTKIFMENHVFAVWDFMSLLKTLQRSLTCVSVPWIPKKNTRIVNFINSIVLEEECDDLGTKDPNNAISHFELYIKSMIELKCNSDPILNFKNELIKGKLWRDALDSTQCLYPFIPASTFNFVVNTLNICENSKIHEVAGSFLFGRENPIPLMYTNIIKNFDEKNILCKNFRIYLERHIEIDSSSHGILAEKLLVELCGRDKLKWNEVEEVAIRSIMHRIDMWDGVLAVIKKNHRKENDKL